MKWCSEHPVLKTCIAFWFNFLFDENVLRSDEIVSYLKYYYTVKYTWLRRRFDVVPTTIVLQYMFSSRVELLLYL